MSIEKADLYGKTFKNFKDVSFMFFSEEDFYRWFEMKESEVSEEISAKLQPAAENGLTLPTSIPFDGTNNNLLLKQGKKMIVYSWQQPNGPHPLRWQDRDDFSDFVNSL